jgi:flavodoxin
MNTGRRNFVISTLAVGTLLKGVAIMGGAFTQSAFAAQRGQGRILVAFFSWSGNTKAIASQIHQKTGGDLVELELVTPYSRNYNTCLDEAKRDQEQEARPPLKTRIAEMDRYDVVFIGYPNWWATIPMPIATFLEQYDFSGKTLIPFSSHGGGRLGQSVTDIAKLAPRSTIKEAFSVHYGGGRSLSADIDAWLRRIGIEG